VTSTTPLCHSRESGNPWPETEIYYVLKMCRYIVTMSNLVDILVAHPIAELPYIKIQFSHLDGQKKPIYYVEGSAEKAGAKLTLARAFNIISALNPKVVVIICTIS
jgi:hypothetical protein